MQSQFTSELQFWRAVFLPVVDEDGDEASVSAKKRRVESFQQKEKRKRDLGQATSDKSFVEEEKRILRQNADWGPDLVWSSGLAALSLWLSCSITPDTQHFPFFSSVSSPWLCEWSSTRLPRTHDIDVIVLKTFGLLFLIPCYIFEHIIQTLVENARITECV